MKLDKKIYILKKPRKYVDFDGVIKDTYEPLFEDYWEKQKNGEEISKLAQDYYEFIEESTENEETEDN